MYIADSHMAKELDRYTIEEIGIPSMVLMENASRSVVKNIEVILELCKKDKTKIFEEDTTNKYINENKIYSKKILVVAGSGNNGGDGVCVARILHEKGYDVSVNMVNPEGNFTVDLVKQIDIAKKCGVKFIDFFSNSNNSSKRDRAKFDSYDIIVDAIFGIGLTREVSGCYYDVINSLNDLSSDKIVVSIDVPSGIDATTSKVMGIAIKADYTITFGVNKLGLILTPGRDYAGQVIVEDIGFSSDIVGKVCKYQAYDRDNYIDVIPKRIKDSNKGSYGKVLVIAGSKNMAGACYLSAKAAYKMGAGLVKVYTVEDNREIIQTLVPEAILTTYNTESIFDNINNKENNNINNSINTETTDTDKRIEQSLKEAIDWSTVIVLGPGLGLSDVSRRIVEYTLGYAKVPCILDADALNILSEGIYDTTKGDIRDTKKKAIVLDNIIFTPHLRELSRLLKNDVEYIKENKHNSFFLFNDLDCLSQRYNNITINKDNNVLVIKDAVTITTTDEEAYINTSGNNGLSTGGSGDVLTGIIAGLIAGGCSNIEAASLGVYIHGLCADEYVKKFNPYSLCASDILDYLEKVIGGIIDEEVL